MEKQDHFSNSVRKLFNHLEEIYYAKVKLSQGKKKSPTFEYFQSYQLFFKLGDDEEVNVVYRHFEELYDNFKQYILADIFTWLVPDDPKVDPIVLKVPGEKTKQLNLTSFVRVAESMGELGKPMMEEVNICLCRIFYSITLKRSDMIRPEDQSQFKKDQLVLLKKITPKPSNPVAGGDPANILSGLMKNIDIN